MFNFIMKSLVRRMVLFYLAIGMICLIIAGYVTLSLTTQMVQRAEYQKLASLNEAEAGAIRDYVRSILEELTFMSRTLRIRAPFQERRRQESSTATGGGLASISEKLKKSYEEADDIINAQLDAKGKNKEGQEDFFLIDIHGHVFHTLRKQLESTQNVNTGVLKNSGLADLWQKIMKHRRPAISDFSVWKPTSSPSAFIGVPVFSTDEKEFYGIFAVRLGPQKITNYMKLASTAGNTAESYLVGEDLLTRSDFLRQAEGSMLKKTVDGEAVKLAFREQSGTIETIDYKGDRVLSAYSSVGLNKVDGLLVDFKWAILTDIAVSEALRSVNELKYLQFSLYSAVLIFVVLSVYFFSRRIAGPLTILTGQMTKAAEGDLTAQVTGKHRKDEIGLLALAFETMLGTLSVHAHRTLESVNVITASASQISSTAAELSSNTLKTSSAITETTTTAEQVRQAAQVSSEQAKTVSERTRSAAEISRSGKQATRETTLKIGVAKEQMESIRETVLRLSDQSQEIEKIISAVGDIADQSNLLAVNASIEAARAGSEGKGFGVVASEIKSLADQSKTATEQVRAILEEIKKWVTAVVTATEQGRRAVDAGVEQATVAGASIQMLSDSVIDSSQAAGVIEKFSEQQFVGVGQVSSAMASIAHAMEQNLEGASRLETASKRLEELAEEFKTLLDRYKISDTQAA